MNRLGDFKIARGRFYSKREDTGKTLRINESIRISPIRVIDGENEQLGILETSDALRRATEANLDLVEVAPNSRPPVCRIMDYGKWKYQQKKKEAKAKSQSKANEIKEIRLRPGTDPHDLQIKTKRARKFIEDGHKCQFTILFRGRQMAHRDIGFNLFRDIAKEYEDCAHIEMSPRVQGRRMTMMMAPGVKAKPIASIPPPRPKPVAPAAPAAPAAEAPAAEEPAKPAETTQA